jgi:CheY-like chemotaxis protein
MEKKGIDLKKTIADQTRNIILYHLKQSSTGYQIDAGGCNFMLSRHLHVRKHIRLISIYDAFIQNLIDSGIDQSLDQLEGSYADTLEYSDISNSESGYRERQNNVLIVNDSPSQTQALSLSFEQVDFSVHAVSDYSTAIQLLRSVEIDLIIMDICLPGIKALKASSELRCRFAVPVILTGTKSDDNLWDKAVKAGADHYEILPCDYSGLAARAKIILNQRTIGN